jgi:hypothetical protein
MSEETTNDGTWSGLKKTIMGTLTTLIAGGGTWLGVQLFNNHEEPKEEVKTEQVAPAPTTTSAPVIINVQQSQENKQQVKQNGGTNTIVKERIIEKPATTPTKSEPTKEEDPW